MAARPFSGFPVAPASPRELVHVDNAQIFTQQLDTENMISAKSAERFRVMKEERLMMLLGLGTKKPVALPATEAVSGSPRLPSSSAGSRIQYGWNLTDAERAQMLASVKAIRRTEVPLHRPLISSPRRGMPPHYGRTLHTQSSTGTDPRSK